jgi:hypothetical protein
MMASGRQREIVIVGLGERHRGGDTRSDAGNMCSVLCTYV